MAEYDLVIRNTTIATASDVVKGDIGVLGGRVVALGERLDKGRKEIDASGLIAVPGGIDAHVHFDQDTADGSVFCDDFESGSRAAAAGGTTTIIPFAYQSKGQPLRDVVSRYHKRADGKSLIDYAFHVILSDPSEKIMGQDFAALVADGYTSFKVYMTYDDMKLSDREMLDALAAARREQAMQLVRGAHGLRRVVELQQHPIPQALDHPALVARQQILPHRDPFLLVDEVLELVPGKRVVARRTVTAADCDGHFPGNPIMPGVKMVEALAQCGAVAVLSLPENRGKLALFAGIDEVRFKRIVRPGDLLDLECEVETVRGPVGKGKVRASVAGELAVRGTLTFAVER
mgnify:CR=1 FL=1